MKSFKQYLLENSNVSFLSWSASTWYVHFFKTTEHGESIIQSGIIKVGEDEIAWAIKQGNKYNASQIETHFETGESVSRAGAIVFAPFDAPDVDNLHGLSAWKQDIELSVGYLVSFELGKDICNDSSIDEITFKKVYEYDSRGGTP